MKTIKEMALEAEFPAANYPALVADGDWAALERFAKLVREEESEACAKACDELRGINWGPEQCATAIRARSNT